MLKRAVRVDMDTQRSGDMLKVTVTLENKQPHSVPTGAPFRNVFLKVTALTKDGAVLWQNYQTHPKKEDPKAYLVYSMVDDEGNPAPPPKATKAGSNTRLKPFEVRTLSYEVPADGVDSVRTELYYALLWAGLAKKMTHLPDDLKTPKLIGWAENKL
jgi:hypothetical protein